MLRIINTLLHQTIVLASVAMLSACGGGGGGDTGTDPGSGGGVDVALTSITAPAAANAGESITVQTNAVNQGSSLIGISVFFYLSLDNSITVADTYYSVATRYALGVGESVTFSKNITLPSNLPSGTYYFGVWADRDNALSESNESNNQQVAAITITGTTCSEDSYEENDSSVTAAPFTVGTVQSHIHCMDDNDWVSFDTLAGTAYGIMTSELGAQSDTKLELYDTDKNTLLETDYDGGVIGQASSLSWTAPASGTYYLRVQAQQGLKDIGPNTDYNLVIADPAADLTVTSTGINGSTALTSGDLVPITYTVVNQGLQDAASTTLGAYLSIDPDVSTADTLIGTVEIGALTVAAQESDSLDFWAPLPGGITDGTYYLAVIADHDETLGEMNEANNVSSAITVTVNAPPCTIDSYEEDDTWQQAQPAMLDESRSHNFCDDWADYVYVDLVTDDTIIIQAFGTADPIDPYIAVYDESGTYLGGESDDISQNADYVFTAPSSGRYYIAAKTANSNYGGSTYDRSYNFNIYTQVPDLTVYSSGIRQSLLYPGTAAFVNTTIQNLGYADAGNFYIKYYMSADNIQDGSDTLLATHLVDAAAIGLYTNTTAQIAIPDTAVPGAYYLLVAADPDNLMAETNETNNTNTYDIAFTVNTAVCGADAYEQNDTAADANVIAVGDSQIHNLCDERLDWMKLSTTAGQQYLFSASNYSYMRIIDSDTSTELMAGNQYLHWQAPASGTYYMLLAPEYYLDTNGTNSSTTITLQSCDKDAYEDDDSSVSAVLITAGSTQIRNHCDDMGDWLALDAINGTAYTFATSSLGINSDTEITVLDSNAFFTEAYNDNRNGSTLESEVSWTAPTDGRYYIHIENKNIGENTDYTLTLTSP